MAQNVTALTTLADASLYLDSNVFIYAFEGCRGALREAASLVSAAGFLWREYGVYMRAVTGGSSGPAVEPPTNRIGRPIQAAIVERRPGRDHVD